MKVPSYFLRILSRCRSCSILRTCAIISDTRSCSFLRLIWLMQISNPPIVYVTKIYMTNYETVRTLYFYVEISVYSCHYFQWFFSLYGWPVWNGHYMLRLSSLCSTNYRHLIQFKYPAYNTVFMESGFGLLRLEWHETWLSSLYRLNKSVKLLGLLSVREFPLPSFSKGQFKLIPVFDNHLFETSARVTWVMYIND